MSSTTVRPVTARSSLLLVITATIAAHAAILVPAPASAFGVLVSDVRVPAPSIKGSRTLVTRDAEGRTVQMTEIHFGKSEAETIFWVLPVPATDTLEVHRCRGSLDDLEAIAEPRVILRHRAFNTKAGCGGEQTQQVASANIDAHVYEAPEVASDAAIDVLPPDSDFEQVEAWMAEHSVKGPDAANGLFSHYTDQGYRFVTTDISQPSSSGTICLALTYDLPSPRVYDYLLPLKTAKASSSHAMEVLVYVLDDGRTRPYVSPDTGDASYYAVELDHDDLLFSDDDQTNYAAIFDEAISTDPPSFVVEFSGRLDTLPDWLEFESRWLTRLRIELDPAEVPEDDPEAEPEASSDLPLEVLGEDEVERDYHIIVASASSPRRGGMLIALTGIGVALALRRRRTKE